MQMSVTSAAVQLHTVNLGSCNDTSNFFCVDDSDNLHSSISSSQRVPIVWMPHQIADPGMKLSNVANNGDGHSTTIPLNSGENKNIWAENGCNSETTDEEKCITAMSGKTQGGGNSFSVENDVKDEIRNESLFVPCVAVFSSNYNFVVTSIAVYIMIVDDNYKSVMENVVGSSTIKMISYAASTIGMLLMGYMGDIIGRRLAMIFTLFLVLFSALGSGLLAWGTPLTTVVILGVFRFFLGIGSGGVYPLSAVTAVEGTTPDQKDVDRSKRVSWAYSMNVPGILFPYILALGLWKVTGGNVEFCFRALLVFGAVPAFVVWIASWRMKDDRKYISKNFAGKIFKAFISRSHWKQLLGTGVCWFMYDVTAYGILLIQPDITQIILGGTGSVEDITVQNILLNAIGIPGCYMGILVIRQMGLKWLQFWGFVGLAASSLTMAATVNVMKDMVWGQFAMLAVINFFINWGASITTFVLPSILFPPDVRSTYSGISAGMGKVGAVLGIYIMKWILHEYGLANMMVAASIPSVIAAILTWKYVDPVSNTFKSSCIQCFGSLGGCIPFVDCRRRKGQCASP